MAVPPDHAAAPAAATPDRDALFPQFPMLPAEIRVMVWERSITPRLLHLKYMHRRAILTLEPRANVAFVPPIVQVCHESRDLCLGRHRLTRLVLNPGLESRVFFFPMLDKLYFGCRFHRNGGVDYYWGGETPHLPFDGWDIAQGTTTNMVRRVAFEARLFSSIPKYGDPSKLLAAFSSLESIDFVVSTHKHQPARRLSALVDGLGFESTPDFPLSQITHYPSVASALRHWRDAGTAHWSHVMRSVDSSPLTIRIVTDWNIFAHHPAVLERIQRDREIRQRLAERRADMDFVVVTGPNEPTGQEGRRKEKVLSHFTEELGQLDFEEDILGSLRYHNAERPQPI